MKHGDIQGIQEFQNRITAIIREQTKEEIQSVNKETKHNIPTTHLSA
jgi:hypothetical protein